MFCIECKGFVNDLKNKKVMCKYCGKKIDKYMQLNNTYKLIDCLLLKDQVFRHFILNNKNTTYSIFEQLGIHFSVLLIIKLSNLRITKVFFKGFYLDLQFESPMFQIFSFVVYILLLNIFTHRIRFSTLLFCILFSSFFNIFKIIFSFWQYNDIQYYLIIEILNCCSNICALKCFDNSHLKLCWFVILSKLASFILTKGVFNYYYKPI
ncbi:sterol homeostasis protein [Glugoides intestinalis]